MAVTKLLQDFWLLVKLAVLQYMVLIDLVLTHFLILLSLEEEQLPQQKKLTHQDKHKRNFQKELERSVFLSLINSDIQRVQSQLLRSDLPYKRQCKDTQQFSESKIFWRKVAINSIQFAKAISILESVIEATFGTLI